MMIPPKLQHGDNLANLFQKYNEMIEYLRETRLIAGPGMRINHLATGITIESTATATGGTPAAPPKGHSFDAEIINKGTEANPQYYARIYNSALPDSPYAGILYVGDFAFDISVAEIAINTQNGFFIDLSVRYTGSGSNPFTTSFNLRQYGTPIPSSDTTYIAVVAEGKLPDIASRITEDITVTGRWI